MAKEVPWWLRTAEQLLDTIDEKQTRRQVSEPVTAPPPQGPTVVSPDEAPAGQPGAGQQVAFRQEPESAREAAGRRDGSVSCDQCRHNRPPLGSLVALALNVMPMRTMANSEAVRDAQRAESTQLAEEVNAHPAVIDQAMLLPSQARDATSDARPLAYPYCAEHEMEMIFELEEIKNAEGSCDSFQPIQSAATRRCATCRHNREPVAQLLPLLQEPFANAGEPGADLYAKTVQEPLKLRADLELDELVRTQGILSGCPVHFPYCTKRGTPGTRTVIGPLVNLGNLCADWERRGATVQEPWESAFSDLRALRRDLDVFTENEPTGPSARNVLTTLLFQEEVLQKRVEAAEVEFIRMALKALGFSSQEANGVASQLAAAQEKSR